MGLDLDIFESIGDAVKDAFVRTKDIVGKAKDIGKNVTEAAEDVMGEVSKAGRSKAGAILDILTKIVDLAADILTIYDFLTTKVGPEVHETYQYAYNLQENLGELMKEFAREYSPHEAPELQSRFDILEQSINRLLEESAPPPEMPFIPFGREERLVPSLVAVGQLAEVGGRVLPALALIFFEKRIKAVTSKVRINQDETWPFPSDEAILSPAQG